ncbi:IclR family transcriptional regulator [Haloarchaeobius sp. DFWS5]|uniref:IclR family transcriptional regulator n=1 Tax=Haloarchaeobius sp. DFWS5 TaxID=3446114 RepID=UPI003EBFC319
MNTPVKTAENTFRVVEALESLESAGLAEVVEYLDMPRSTVHDHVRTLELLGYVVKRDETYSLGTRFLEIGDGSRSRMPIYRHARTEVEGLAAETGEHASLMIEENGLGVLLYVAKGENAVNIGAYAGMRMPLSTTAPGKAILAHLPQKSRERYLDRHGLPPVTEQTVTDSDVLLEQLNEIHERGYATDYEERIDGVCAVSVPICRGETVEGAITVGGPTNRMNGETIEAELPRMLLRAANVIEVNLTYS